MEEELSLKNSYLEASLSQVEFMGTTRFCQDQKKKNLYTVTPTLLLAVSHTISDSKWKYFYCSFFLYLKERGGEYSWVPSKCEAAISLHKRSDLKLPNGTNQDVYLGLGWGALLICIRRPCAFPTCIILRYLMSDCNRNGIRRQTMTVMKVGNNEMENKSRAVWRNQIVQATNGTAASWDQVVTKSYRDRQDYKNIREHI